jgi:hypothetical protein
MVRFRGCWVSLGTDLLNVLNSARVGGISLVGTVSKRGNLEHKKALF